MFDDLIYAMSARGVISLDEFNSIFRTVYAPGISDKENSIDIDIRRQVIRLFDSLGYCEFNFDTRRVYMCEPSFVLLPTFGLPKAVLAGARTPLLIKKIKDEVKCDKDKMELHFVTQNTADFNMPALIYLEAIEKALIKNISERCGISYDLDKPAAWALANFCGSVEERKKSIHFAPFVELDWKRRAFTISKLVFSSREPVSQDSLFLLEYKNPITQQRRHLLLDGDSAAEVDRDWGRYMVLSSSQSQVIIYNERIQKLAVPVTVPLPCLLARAISMCTGLVPKITTVESRVADIPSNHPVYVYSGVPKVIAELISRKLGQKLFNSNFEYNEKGALND